MDEKPKRGPGRPVTTGITPTRDIRIGVIWDEAQAIAQTRGDTMTSIVRPAIEHALRQYIAEHVHDDSGQ